MERITTKTHEDKKKLLQLKLESQSKENPSITYRPVEKILVEGEQFDELFEDGHQTFYIKCLNPVCERKGFMKQ